MRKRSSLRIEPRFVDAIPNVLEARVIYVSMRYRTAVHSCVCGCGNEVVTPLSPAGWSILFDGETISMRPSIGNWSFPCQSHYWIEENAVRWARKWSKKQIREVRREDAADLARLLDKDGA